MKERFEDLADMLIHLANGGKIGSDNWSDDKWFCVRDNSIVNQDDSIYGGIINVEEYYFKKRYKWKPQPRKVGIAEVCDLLDKGAWLRPLHFTPNLYYYLSQDILYISDGEFKTKSTDIIFILSQKEWIVIKEPQE